MKSRNLTQSSLHNDPINFWMQGFSFRIFEDKSGVEDVISFFSFDQSLISRVQLKQKRVKITLKQTTRDLVENTLQIWRIFPNMFFVSKNGFYKSENYVQPLDLMDSSRWTAPIGHQLMNRCLLSMSIRSLIDARDLISSRKEGVAQLLLIRRILIGWFVFDRRSISVD